VTSLIYTIFAFVIAISVLVVVHEFGHYWVARLAGVKVLRFSLGFGKTLWSRRYGRDRTEWVIAAIPLGGYVKMLDEQEEAVAAHELPRAFNRQPLWKRAVIVLAGPMFNLLFAVSAYSALNMVGVDGIRPVVGKVAEGSLAQRGGFRVGDVFSEIDGHPVQGWDERRLYLYERALDHATVHYKVRDRDGLPQERLLDFSSLTAADVGAGLIEREIGMLPVLPELEPVIGTLEARGHAAQAGMQAGDRIVAIDGQPTRIWSDVVQAVSRRPGEALRISVERNGVRHELAITALPVESGGKTFGRIGVGVRAPVLPPEMRVTLRYSPIEALAEGTETTWRMSVLTLKMLVKMVQLEVSTKTISGPLTIAQYAGASAEIGFSRFILFLAVVSVSLGVLNLLPIPVLDGGHLLLYTVESVLGRPLSERTLSWMQRTGIVLLAALMALALFNDFMRLLS
jgi:regulator of sigma E protease